MTRTARYVLISEILSGLGTDVEFLESLEAEGLIELKRTAEGDRVVSSEDAERIRVVLLLVSDLEVNMPGAEVIVHMREAMLAMQRQFGEILEAIVEEMRRRRPS